MDKDTSNKLNQEDSQENIQSLGELKAWLVSKGIDISQWGCGTAKTVENLWDEIVNGETHLQENPPLRIIPVVQIIIRDGNNILMEFEQEFDDKRKRFRNHPPSEKIKLGENYRDTAIRCLQEELGVKHQNIEIIASTYRQKQTEKESPSYPGLRTRYIFHVVEARVDGLSDTDFWTIESGQTQGDPVKRHHWVWQTQIGETN